LFIRKDRAGTKYLHPVKPFEPWGLYGESARALKEPENRIELENRFTLIINEKE
jgi:hypothetical protein